MSSFGESHALDLSKRHFTHILGQITVIGTWVATDEGNQPCLVLIRTGEELDEHTIPCVVALDAAVKWDTDNHKHWPDWARSCALQAFEFADALRCTDLKLGAIGVITLIENHLDELCAIPPYQHEALTSALAMLEVTINDTSTGKRVREVML